MGGVALVTRAFMDERGWRIADLSRASGVCFQVTSDVLSLRRFCSLDVLEKIGAAFGLDYPDFSALAANALRCKIRQ